MKSSIQNTNDVDEITLLQDDAWIQNLDAQWNMRFEQHELPTKDKFNSSNYG